MKIGNFRMLLRNLRKQSETKQCDIPIVVVTEGKCCDSIEQSGYYLGTTCPKCKRPFRVPKVKQH